MNGQIIPEETEKSIEVKQENATFLVIGDKAYTSEIIEEYNRNAEAKTEAFNTNAENKIASYNSNAADRTTAFNNNYDNKISAFNSNANTQKEEFDSHVLIQTNTFNKNAASKLQEYNDNATQKIEEYDLHSQELDNKIIATRNELERVKNDVLETGTDTDTYIHLEDSAMAEYQELSVDGVCEQVTTIGKNLLNTNNNIGEITQNGISISIENSMINFNGTSTIEDGTTQSFNKIYNFNKSIVLPAGNYTFGSKVISGSFITSANSRIATIKLLFASNDRSIQTNKGSTDFTTNSFTISDNNAIRGIQIITEGKILFNNLKLGLQLEEGSIATNWEPYTGGKPSPSPEYPQEIKTIENSLKITSCNKNLFDYENSQITNTYGSVPTKKDNGYLGGWAFTVTLNEPIKAGTYTISFEVENSDNGAGANLRLRNKDNVSISNDIKCHNSNTVTLTVNEDIYGFRLDHGTQATTTLIKNIMISSIPSEYEEHLETQIEANLPEGEFIGKINDTYKDTLKVEYNEEDGNYHLVLNKNIGKYLINGTETPTIDITKTNTTRVYLWSAIKKAKSIMTGIPLSNMLIGNECWNNDIEAIYTNNDSITFRINKDVIGTTADEIKSWLSAHNIELYYPLKTPYTVDLGIVDMPITYNEVTNLFTDSDLLPQINAKYYRNFISTVRNLQVNEKALKQELVDINTRLSALESAQTSTTQESEVTE